MELRDYQEKAVNLIRNEIRKGNKKILLVLPTGAGKSHTMGDITYKSIDNGHKVLSLMHRRQLVTQLTKIFEDCGVTSSMIMSGEDSSLECNAQIATCQTYLRRIKLDPIEKNPFFIDASIVFIDEAHHVLSNTYQKILSNYKDKIVIGVTATPILSSGVGMGKYFDVIVNPIQIHELIERKYLVPGVYYGPSTPDLSKLKTMAGDYEKKGLNKLMNQPKLIGDVIENWLKIAGGLSTMVFAVKVDHSKALCQAFINKGVTAEHLDAHAPDDVREETLWRFRNGDTQVICNVGLYCLDDQTEILTSDGWKNKDLLSEEDKIANWEESGSIFFKKPEYIVKRSMYDNEFFVSTQSRSSNIRVTNTHKVISRCPNGVWHKTSAENLIGKIVQYPVCGDAKPIIFNESYRKQLVNVSKSRFITSNSWLYRKSHGLNMDESKSEALRIWNIKSKIKTKLPHELTIDECMLIGFWIGDGSLSRLNKGGIEYKLYQSKRYPEIIEWIENLLIKVGYSNIKREKTNVFLNGKQCHNLIHWSLCRGTGGRNQHRKGLYAIEPYLNKDGTSLFWGLNKKQIKAVLHGLWMADGDHILQKTKRIANTNKKLLDLLQSVAVCRGLIVSICKSGVPQKKCHSQRYSFFYMEGQNYRNIAGKYKLHKDKDQSGSVWCVKSESGNIVTRRDGRVCITGNTEGTDIKEIECIILARPTKSLGLHLQMIGRGARPCKNKDKFLILDHGGNIDRLGFYEDEILWSLSGKEPGAKKKVVRKKEKKIRTCEECNFLFTGPTCPQCGKTIKGYGKMIEAEEAELVEIGKKRSKATMQEKCKFYQMAEYQRRSKNYSPKYANALYKEKFGVWPRGLENVSPLEPDRGFKNYLTHKAIAYHKRQEKKEGAANDR